MILVCEIMFDKGAHVPFNAGLLATIRAAFPKEDLSFYGAAAHIEALKKQIGQPLASSIVWSEILPIPPRTGYCERFFRELRRHSASIQNTSSRLNFPSALDVCLSLNCAGVESCAMFPIEEHPSADGSPWTEWSGR